MENTTQMSLVWPSPKRHVPSYYVLLETNGSPRTILIPEILKITFDCSPYRFDYTSRILQLSPVYKLAPVIPSAAVGLYRQE